MLASFSFLQLPVYMDLFFRSNIQCFRNYYLTLQCIIPNNILLVIFKQEAGKIHEHFEGSELLLQVTKTLSANLHSVHPLIFLDHRHCLIN